MNTNKKIYHLKKFTIEFVEGIHLILANSLNFLMTSSYRFLLSNKEMVHGKPPDCKISPFRFSRSTTCVK